MVECLKNAGKEKYFLTDTKNALLTCAQDKKNMKL